MFNSPKLTALVYAALIIGAQAETHIITFTNLCGRGVPTSKENGVTLSTGGAVTFEGCLMVETTLVNPTTPGSGSSTDLTLITPHSFSVTTGFGYFGGCNGAGADCVSASCTTAFHVSTDTGVQVACQSDNVNLAIAFCD
ncbi:glycopeptide [Lentinula aciculospora]|uniref:Glycopeptide n=1 Tax=Lentinula aciculospora TaxID=153920 RepID=A0A9W9AQG3_9AGAR|nr:glycopeptide [Lentinula aciculospora]